MPIVLQNANIVLHEAVLDDSSLTIDDGRIIAINQPAPPGARCVDLCGKILMPGLIDLHCDALEKFIEPRPNVLFPLEFALAQADRATIAAGITTPFHAVAFSEGELGVRDIKLAAQIVREIGRRRGLCDTHVHVRYEITDRTAQDPIRELLEDGAVQMISFMDHTPGQGQFKTLEAYALYISRTYGRTLKEAEGMAAQKLEDRKAGADRVAALARVAAARHIPLASHDDDSPERVELMASLGATISEFPINLETARAARAQGMATILGAPNVLRGRSQAGSLRALDAVLNGVADCLCADYVPSALLAACFRLTELAGLNLATAARLVTANPARAAGLHDRGEIAIGKRADLIAVDLVDGQPHVTQAWVNGHRAFASDYARMAVTSP